jgi:hypothetical protein
MKNGSLWFALLLVLTLGMLSLGAPVAHAQDVIGAGPTGEKIVLTGGMEHVFWHAMAILRVAFWVMIVSHVLFALLVLMDIRKRGEGCMLFVLLALLTGACGALVYGVFRVGDKKA